MAGPNPRVFLVDDHQLLRDTLRTHLELSGMLVIGEAATLVEALERIPVARPDVVVMDVHLIDGSGIEATREIMARLPDTKVLVVTSDDSQEVLFASIMAGASGFLRKDRSVTELVGAITALMQGQSLLDGAATAALLEKVRTGVGLEDQGLASLTEREDRVLAMISQGKTNIEIAAELHFSERTVKNVVSSVLGKLHVSRRAEAVAYYVRRRPGS